MEREYKDKKAICIVWENEKKGKWKVNEDSEKDEDSKTCRKWLIEKEKKERDNKVKIEKWEKYFKKQLRGIEEKVMREERGGTEAGEEEKKIRKEEVVLTLKKLKDGKTIGRGWDTSKSVEVRERENKRLERIKDCGKFLQRYGKERNR